MEKSVLVISAASSKVASPFTMETGLVPTLVEAEKQCVNCSTDTGMSEVIKPISEGHPMHGHITTNIILLSTCRKNYEYQNSPSSSMINPNFSFSLLGTLFHSSEL